MSKVDRLKEEPGWLKLVFGIVVAVDVSLIAWLAQNYESTSRILVVCGFIGVAFVTAVGVWGNRAAMKRFKELEAE
jgi:4-hydroxybenzoate polyprenyltransferase